MANHELISADDDHDVMPSRTMPQGTQLHGVEHGHEERDVNFGPLLKYIAGLVITIVVSILVTFGAYRFLLVTEEQAQKPLPQAYTAKETPPEPRLLPNPADAVPLPSTPEWQIRRHETLVGPGDYGQAELRAQREALAKLGLFDKEHEVPVVPDTLVSAVPGATTGGKGMDSWPPEEGVREFMPADSSGGSTVENRLR